MTRSIISASNELMKFDRLFLPGEERLVSQSGDKHGSLRAPTGRPSCDATSLKLGIINFITQHDESSDSQTPPDGHLGFGVTSAQGQALVAARQVGILAHRYLISFHQIEA